MSPIKISLVLLCCVTFVFSDDGAVAGISVEDTLENVGGTVDNTLAGVGKREASEPDVQTRILGMLGLGRRKRQAEESEIQTRILGALGRKKRQAEENVQTRGLLGRKKRDVPDVSLNDVVQIADILS